MAMEDVSVVLAHGAWADGSSWARVITALAADAVKVFAAPLPLTSLADDVAALNRSLDRTEGPIVLAGHAYAGAVIALARPERVKALVYVTALAPDEGESCVSVMEPFPPSMLASTNVPSPYDAPGAAGGPDLFIKIDQFHDFDPSQDYEIRIAPAELSDDERAALTADDVALDL